MIKVMLTIGAASSVSSAARGVGSRRDVRKLDVYQSLEAITVRH